MADIVSSLFGLSPIQQEAELTSRKRNYDLGTLIGQAGTTGFMTPTQSENYVNRNAAKAALAGTALRGVAGMFGLQDPQLKRASSLEGILQSTQQELGEQANDPTVFYPQLQRNLASGGFSREAFEVAQVGQKAIQESILSQAKLAQEQTNLEKAKKEKLPEIVRLSEALDDAIANGETARAKVIQAEIDKRTFIPEKVPTPQNAAQQALLDDYVTKFGKVDGSRLFTEEMSKFKQKENAATGTGITGIGGEIVGNYDEKGNYISKGGEVIPKEQMVDYRTGQDNAFTLLNLMNNITNTDIDNAYGKPNITNEGFIGGASRLVANPEVTSAQTKINSLGVEQVLTNLQRLKGASSDREMSRMASTFPGFEAPPQVMKEWLARAILTTTKFLNKNKAQFGFVAPEISLQELGDNPTLKALTATELANYAEDFAKSGYDKNFNALSDTEKVKALNSIVSGAKLQKQGGITKAPVGKTATPTKKTRTTKSGVKYTIED